MGKRQPPIVYTGSLKYNFWGYITKYHMAINPKDFYAQQFFIGQARIFDAKKFKGMNPLFKHSVEFLDGASNHSFAKITWVTDMEQKVFVHMFPDVNIYLSEYIRRYNLVCENQRISEGHDDEPEDETAYLL